MLQCVVGCQLSVPVACHVLCCLPERQPLTRKSTICYEKKFQVCLKLLAKHSGVHQSFLARAQMVVTIEFCVNT